MFILNYYIDEKIKEYFYINEDNVLKIFKENYYQNRDIDVFKLCDNTLTTILLTLKNQKIKTNKKYYLYLSSNKYLCLNKIYDICIKVYRQLEIDNKIVIEVEDNKRSNIRYKDNNTVSIIGELNSFYE